MSQTYFPKLPQLSEWAKFYSLSGDSPILLVGVKKIGLKNDIVDFCLSQLSAAFKKGQKDIQKDVDIFSFWGLESIQEFEKKINLEMPSRFQNQDFQNSVLSKDDLEAEESKSEAKSESTNQSIWYAEDPDIFLENILWSCLLVIKKETIAGFELGKMVSISYGPVLNMHALGLDSQTNFLDDQNNQVFLDNISENKSNSNSNSSNIDSNIDSNQAFDKDLAVDSESNLDKSFNKNSDDISNSNSDLKSNKNLGSKSITKELNNQIDLEENQKRLRTETKLAESYLKTKKEEIEVQFLACSQISNWVGKNLKNISYCLFEPYLKDDFSVVWEKSVNINSASTVDPKTEEPKLDLFRNTSQKITQEYQNNFQKWGFKKHYRKVYTPHRWILDIQKNPELLLKEMKKNTRYAIKQAQKQGIECDFVRDEAQKSLALNKFYDLLKKTAEKQVFYIPKKSHFENILEAFGDRVQIYWSYPKDKTDSKKDSQFNHKLADDNFKNTESILDNSTLENCLSMALICRDGGCSYLDFLNKKSCFISEAGNIQKYQTAYYLWAASDPEKINNKIPAQHPVLWHAILDSQKLGCTHFDFWGLDQNPLYANREGKSHGYDTFKIGFGGFYQEILPPFFVIKSFWRFYLIDAIARLRFLIMR